MTVSILWIIIPYLVGSIPTGLILSRAIAGVDIRERGSGNIGATNAYRTVGKSVGILTLVGDALKGFLPVIVALKSGIPDPWVAGVGLCAFLGHVFSLFLRFRGGKGVATGLGVFLALTPTPVLIALAIFIVVVSITRYVSLGSITAAATLPLASHLLGYPPERVATTLLIALIVIAKHHENIARLIRGTENRFTL